MDLIWWQTKKNRKCCTIFAQISCPFSRKNILHWVSAL